MNKLAFIFLWAFASATAADTLVSTRTIRSHTIIGPADVKLEPIDSVGSLTQINDAVGKETRVVLYAGRPIRPQDIGPAAIIERNQIVQLVYRRGGLRIVTDARSLGRGGVGDYLRVMNLTSKTTVSGTIDADGSVVIGY
ncbi:MAG TPA: flagella basal body P-ring formation protein FlgA [Rhodobacteraceae bacterium]|jgi:flagella basal body P-ring formation protein FlgA|nr:flagella basal body P-ring formation protein FlgA [Paracoccaceae bacterium]